MKTNRSFGTYLAVLILTAICTPSSRDAYGEIIGGKPKTAPVAVDPSGTEWFKDEDGNLFTWDEKFRRPLFRGNHGLVTQPHKERKFLYGLLCRPEGDEGGLGFYQDALTELLQHPSRYRYPFTDYYQDVNRLMGIFTEDECQKYRSSDSMDEFLKRLGEVCYASCAELAPEYQSGTLLFKGARIRRQTSECAGICDLHLARQHQAEAETKLKCSQRPDQALDLTREIQGERKEFESDLPGSSVKFY